MNESFKHIFSLIVPQEADPRIRFCGIQMIILVMIWFLIQGSGFIPDAQTVGANHQAGSQNTVLNVSSQCLGGIIGSLLFLFEPSGLNRSLSFMPSRLKRAHRNHSLFYVAVLAIVLMGAYLCALQGQILASAILRLIACSLVTILFLSACLTLAKWSPATALAVFFFVSLCRIVQSLIMLPFEPGVLWFTLSLIIELALVAAYFVSLVKQLKMSQSGDAPCSPGQSSGTKNPSDSENTTGQSRYLPWQFVLHVMLYYFVIGLLLLRESPLAIPGFQTNCSYLLASVIAFGLFYAMFVRTGSTLGYWVRIRQIAFPLLMASSILTGILPSNLLFLSLIMTQAAYRFFLLSSYVEMFAICDITAVNARHVFAVTHLVMYVAMLTGGILGIKSQTGVTDPFETLVITLLLFVCLTAASCWLGNDKSAGKVWGRRIELTPKGRHEEIIKTTCNAIAEQYHLTAKETEVLELLVRKQSLDQIAVHLVISKNTVRTHVRNLYAKVNAHSQSDIYLLFDRISNELKPL